MMQSDYWWLTPRAGLFILLVGAICFVVFVGLGELLRGERKVTVVAYIGHAIAALGAGTFVVMEFYEEWTGLITNGGDAFVGILGAVVAFIGVIVAFNGYREATH